MPQLYTDAGLPRVPAPSAFCAAEKEGLHFLSDEGGSATFGTLLLSSGKVASDLGIILYFPQG